MTGFFDTSPATTTETTNQTTTANPWAQASPLLTSMAQYYSGLNPAVTGQQTQAGQNLWGEASAVPSYGVQGAGAVNNLFSGLGILPSAYSKLQQNLGSVANPNNTNPYNTPGFSDALNTMTNNITNAVKGVYSGSGRSPSGAGTFAKTLGLGLTQGEAPILQQQYNANTQNMLTANQILQNAGISTVGAMGGDTMQALQAAGILPQVATAPGQTQLGVANTLYGQPIQNANALLSPALSLGQAGRHADAGAEHVLECARRYQRCARHRRQSHEDVGSAAQNRHQGYRQDARRPEDIQLQVQRLEHAADRYDG